MPDDKHYMIRRSSDGKFAAGGSFANFTKIGKVWSRQTLKAHLSLVYRRMNRWNSTYPTRPMNDLYAGCEIITLCVDPNHPPISVGDFNP